ncbi:ABC transporter ATP-binding protein [Litoribrevibacter euphylliae]|uniref:ABC transporter ATP-binding protein n=1 Tax=Litoribrevibacter euphylliae TaxID=1834034 RepID=A0ABV7HKD9_9GAMM
MPRKVRISSSETEKKRSLISRLFTYSLPHKSCFVSAFFMLFVAVVSEMAIPWLAKVILDEVIVPQKFDWAQLLGLIGAIFAFYCIASCFSYWQAVTFRHSALLVVNDIRKELFSHVLNFPIKTFDRQPAGKLVSNITNDTESMRDMFVSTFPAMVQGSLRIIAIFIAIALLDWRLMLLSLALIPLLLIIMHLYRRISMPIFDGVRVQVSRINSQLNEYLQGMDLIQAFRREASFQERFEKENRRWLKFRSKAISIDSLMLIPLTRLVATFTAAVIVAWFAVESFHSVIEVGTLFAFLSYIERFFDPFRQLSMELRKLQVATVGSKRVFELLDSESDHEKHLQLPVELENSRNIEFRNIYFSYDEGTPVLKNVNFVAKGGEFTAIVGPSGSGKSSLVNLLMRFYEPQSGEILIGGQSLYSIPDIQLRELVGLVSQDPIIFSGSILENIDLSNHVSDLKTASYAAQQVQANQFIEKLKGGYNHTPGHSGTSLSIGEKQLVALARALSHDPDIFLLDEATANIDSETEESVKRAIEKFKDGRTVVCVAHRLSTIRNADQILVMNKGQIVQRGTHDELVTQMGNYRDLYLAQKEQEENVLLDSSFGLSTSTV